MRASPTAPVRIAMWSGPRNISTAMMRAWENRPDTTVVDEPFYAYYLHQTGIDHPDSQEVIDSYETDYRRVAHHLTQDPLPSGTTIYYQKQMTHHILPETDLGWMATVINCFLIRDPREVITSYIKVRPDATLEDIGFPQQLRLFRHVTQELGQSPIVIDARDVLTDPRGTFLWLCEQIGVPFTEQMLSWPPGPRESDGVWAKHWYEAVWASTGFAPYRPKPDRVPEDLMDVWQEAEAIYQEMKAWVRNEGRLTEDGKDVSSVRQK